MLSGNAGKIINGRVTITPKAKYPFKILSARARQGKYIKFCLTEIKRSNAMGYVLTVENLKKERGRYAEQTVFGTNFQVVISITFRGGRTYYRKREVFKKADPLVLPVLPVYLSVKPHFLHLPI
jgi:hypothetical protein